MRRIVPIGLAACALVLLSAAAHAQSDALSVHGYLTQGYGLADGGEFLGIPERGTTNYRTAALQFRYTLSPEDHFVVQMSHRRLGEAELMGIEPEVRFDWVFYERRFEAFRVKVGRIPIPAGIYNEIRDVGTLLPFYRAPFGFYGEGAFTSETVDGVVAAYRYETESLWSVEVSGFFGGWDLIEQTSGIAGLLPPAPPTLARAENGVGGQLWIDTPLPMVRAGFGASRYEIKEGLLRDPGETETWKEWHVSFDGTYDRFTLQGEYRKITFPDVVSDGYYGHVGITVVDQFSLHGQIDRSDLELSGALPLQLDFHDDYAVGVRVMPRPDVVLKAEYHFSEGYRAELPVLAVALGDPAAEVDYLILSVAKSF